MNPSVSNDSLQVQFSERTKKHKEAIFPTIYPTCNSNHLWDLSGSRGVHGDIAPQAWHRGCMSCSTLPVFDALWRRWGWQNRDNIGCACRSSSIVPRKTMSDASHGKHKRPRSKSRDLPKDFRTEAATWKISTLHLRKFNPSHFCDRVLSSRNPRIQRVVSSICTFLLDCAKSISWVSFAPLCVRFWHSLHGFAYDRTATNQGLKKKGRFLSDKPIQAI